jgi:hypothetical protein
LDDRPGFTWKARLPDLEPAPPAAAAPSPPERCGFKPDDWVRVTKKESEFFDQPKRVLKVKVVSGFKWILLDGYPELIDPAILEHWTPRKGDRVVHEKSGVPTSIAESGDDRFFTAHPFNGRRWFKTSELTPYIEKIRSRLEYIHELECALRNASALLRDDARDAAFVKTIDHLLAQGRPPL